MRFKEFKEIKEGIAENLWRKAKQKFYGNEYADQFGYGQDAEYERKKAQQARAAASIERLKSVGVPSTAAEKEPEDEIQKPQMIAPPDEINAIQVNGKRYFLFGGEFFDHKGVHINSPAEVEKLSNMYDLAAAKDGVVEMPAKDLEIVKIIRKKNAHLFYKKPKADNSNDAN